MSADFTYHLTVAAPQGVKLPREARGGPGLATMSFSATEVDQLPSVRAQLAALGATVVQENGAGGRGDGSADDARLLLVLPSVRLGAGVAGVHREANPCGGCGQPTRSIRFDDHPRFDDDPGDIPPLAQTTEGLLVLSDRVVTALVGAGLDAGMRAVPVERGHGAHLVIADRALTAGRPDEAGCDACGRESVLVAGVATPSPARFSIQPAARLPEGSGWWFHPQIGQLLTAVSVDVVALLGSLGAACDATRIRDVDAEEAWLPKEFR